MRNVGRGKKRMIIWLVILAFCVACSVFTLASLRYINNELYTVSLGGVGDTSIALGPHGIVKQNFRIRGRLNGVLTEIHIALDTEADFEGSVLVTLTNLSAERVEMEKNLTLSSEGAGEFVVCVGGELFLPSGQNYCLEIQNQSDDQLLYLRRNTNQSSGELTVDGEARKGVLDASLTRFGVYHPTPLFYLALLLINGTVLLGSGLVLFRQTPVQILYLVLAIGFGLVTLLDLTPLYGFDMRFHFDSAYVLSNQMMGMEGTVRAPTEREMDGGDLFYYRRAEDNYNDYAHYYFDVVSANYVDTYRGLRSIGTTAKNREPELVQTYQGHVGEQLYLYLPQAAAFTLARLVGLGFYPMLQLARIVTYGVFVMLVYMGMRRMPFGKGIFLILGLLPGTLVQTVSITRDALILGMCFYIIGKTITIAYQEGMPRIWDWICLVIVSILLAPCKMAYLPVSFFYLLAIYRKCHAEKCLARKWAGISVAGITAATIGFFLISTLAQLAQVTRTESTGLYGAAAYTMSDILLHPLNTVYVVLNTFREHLGTYFVNGLQLFDIRLGSNEGLSLAIGFLIILEICSVEPGRTALGRGERCFSFLVFFGVLALVTYGAMQWTPVTSHLIEGLQGRYLTPVLPALALSLYNNRLLRTGSGGKTAVALGCCILPAIALMNMYLWTISGVDIQPSLLPYLLP